jgi:hypothetical protein
MFRDRARPTIVCGKIPADFIAAILSTPDDVIASVGSLDTFTSACTADEYGQSNSEVEKLHFDTK